MITKNLINPLIVVNMIRDHQEVLGQFVDLITS